MDYSKSWPNLDESQTMLMDSIHQFANEVVAPKAAHHDETGEFPTETVKQMAEMGLMGMMVEEKWGGAGLGTVEYAMAMESISAACASTGVIMSVNNSLVCYPIQAYGNDTQKEKFGSDPAGLKCRAEKVPGGYKINGSKNWITNGREADYCILFATINPELKHKGICAFVVDTKAKGFSVNKLENKLGITASSTASLFFDDCFVPDECLLGKEGDGFKIAMGTLDGGRIGIASQALGIATCALDASKKFASEREQFGAPIAKLQAIQFYIAEMAT
ncbi:MAG: acyl-CoA dehydrogenase, partial [Proteobacteria bacterium]|nr:acyl-CoA dehydrogenase [Pseudomonadota bacterium]